MLSTIILKNPKATEAAVNLAAMFIHFHKHTRFVIDLTNKEIESLERIDSEIMDREFSQKIAFEQ